jgi:hypothetical protein
LFQVPKYHHPIFYGCFDWHSSVHGHWLLAALLRQFPETELAEKIIKVFDEQFQVSMLLNHNLRIFVISLRVRPS